MDALLAAQIRLLANTLALPTAALWMLVALSWLLAWARNPERRPFRVLVRSLSFWIRILFVALIPAVAYAAWVTRDYYAGIIGGWYTPVDAGRLRVASILNDIAIPLLQIITLALLIALNEANERNWLKDDTIAAKNKKIEALTMLNDDLQTRLFDK